MNSETPQDRHDDSEDRASGPNRPDTPGSLGRELSENLHLTERDAVTGLGHDPMDPGATLMPHERKLSAADQRSILANRRHVDDGVDDSEITMELQRRAERALRVKEWQLEHAAGGHQHAPSRAAQAAEALAGAALLSHQAHPLNAIYDAVHKGIGEQDASRLPLNPSEHANVAAALTAHLSQTPGFDRTRLDPANVSVALSEGNDRVFAIQGHTPGAPDAVYANVAVDQAKQQPLEMSSAQAAIEPPKPAPQQAQAQEQQQEAPTIAPRSLG